MGIFALYKYNTKKVVSLVLVLSIIFTASQLVLRRNQSILRQDVASSYLERASAFLYKIGNDHQ